MTPSIPIHASSPAIDFIEIDWWEVEQLHSALVLRGEHFVELLVQYSGRVAVHEDDSPYFRLISHGDRGFFDHLS